MVKEEKKIRDIHINNKMKEMYREKKMLLM